MNNAVALLVGLRKARVILFSKLEDAIGLEDEELAWQEYRQASEKLYKELAE